MKKFTILFFFMSLLAFSLFTFHSNYFVISNNANTQIETLTHDVNHQFLIDSFNLQNSTYLNIEGNATITLTSEVAKTYFREDDNCNNVSSWGTHTNHESLATFAGKTDVLHLNGTVIPYLAASLDRSETHLWKNETLTVMLYLNSSFILTGINEIVIEIYDNDDKMQVYLRFLAKNATAITLYQYSDIAFISKDVPYNHWTEIRVLVNTSAQNYTCWVDSVLLGQMNFRMASRANIGETLFSTTEANVWVDSFAWNTTISINEYTAGSYASPILDLGNASNWFYDAVAFAIIAPSDSAINLFAYLPGLGWSPIAMNQSIGYEFGRYLQFYVNLTSSSDNLETPSFLWLQLNWTETVADPPPSAPPQEISKYLEGLFFVAVVIVFVSICFSKRSK
jgi:hypothetical protein